MKPSRRSRMATMTLAAALSIAFGGCIGTGGSWIRESFDPVLFAADDIACLNEMYAVRAASSMRAPPNWHIRDYCLIRRGYTLEMTPIRPPL